MERDERWKEVVGYEGLYEISTKGRIMSLRRNIILKPKVDKDLYYRIGLTKNGVRKFYRVHRLVAQAFIPNPNNYPVINHKDQTPNKKYGIPSNNNIENLEWCTMKYNNNYMNHNDLISKAQKNRKDLSTKILQYSLNGNFIKEWESQKEVERILGFKQSNISSACLNIKTHQMFGFMWLKKETENYNIKIQEYVDPIVKPIYQYDLNMNFIRLWKDGLNEIALELNLSDSEKSKIGRCCRKVAKNCNEFIWSYKFSLDNDNNI